MKNSFPKLIISLLILCLIGGLAFSLREYAARRMIADFDEPYYLNLALKYTNAVREGQYAEVAWIRDNAEHPILAKLVYATVMFTVPPIERLFNKDFEMLYPPSEDAMSFVLAARRSSVLLGVITAIVLGLLNPAAGFLIAIQNSAIHYTSVIYLEALPALMSTCSVLCYIVWRKYYDAEVNTSRINKKEGWLLMSAVFLGMAIAGKYVFGMVGLAIGLDYLLLLLPNQRKQRKSVLYRFVVWSVLAIVAFFIANPMLWPKPIDRLLYSLQFHINFSQSETVAKYNYPFWQPFVWLVSQNERYHNAYIFNPDAIILILAFLGLPVTFKKYRVMAIWLMMALVFLLIWDTKWPQYIMILVTPLCLSAGLALQEILKFLRRKIKKKPVGVVKAS